MGTYSSKVEIEDLANEARANRGGAAFRTFVKLAKLNGYEGGHGGWIYRRVSYAGSNLGQVCHGWQALAQRVYDGRVHFRITNLPT